MNTYELIMLDNPILVSDEEIQEECYVNRTGTDINFFALYVKEYPEHFKNCKRIIATTYPFPNIPSIDLSSLSEEDCKKIGWVDVDYSKLCYYDRRNPDFSIKEEFGYDKEEVEATGNFAKKDCSCDNCFYGRSKLTEQLIKAAQSLNEKKYSEEDLRKAFEAGQLDKSNNWYGNDFTQFFQSLSQPKVFQVELEMVEHKDKQTGVVFYLPSITNNSIKIIKVL